MSDVNRTLTSLLLSHTICRHFWRIVVIEVSYILEWIFVFLEAQLVAHLIVELLFLNVFADLGFISTYCIYEYPFAQNTLLPYLYFRFACRSNIMSVLFPLRYPMKSATASLGGIDTSIWI